MDLHALLGDDADDLLNHTSKGIPKEDLHLPGPDFVDRCLVPTDRSPVVLRNLASCTATAASAAPATCRSCPSTRASSTRPRRRSRRTRRTSTRRTSSSWPIEGGCNAVATTFGVLGAVAAQYAHKIPFIVKLNHNELLTYPNKFDQIMFGSVRAGLRPRRGRRRRDDLLRLRRVDAPDPGGRRAAFAEAHELGHVHRAVVLPAQHRLQDRRRRLPRVGRPHRPGQPHRRHDRGRHHQAEAAGEQRRLQRVLGLRQDVEARLRRAHDRPPDRPRAAGRSRTATWAGSGSSTPAASRRAPATWPTRCAPR